MTPFALYSCVLALVALQSVNALQIFNWSISDQSPLITYDPVESGDNTTTWNTTYSLSSWTRYYAQSSYDSQLGEGVSSHASTLPNATATVGFVGTAVYVWGDTAQLSGLIYVDGVMRNFSGGEPGLIGSAEGLDNKWHEVQVLVRGLGTVVLRGFTFTTMLDGDSQANATVNVPVAATNGEVGVVGNWNVQYSTVQDAETHSETNYTTLSTSADLTTSMTLTPPINTTVVRMYGLVSAWTASYAVELDGTTIDPAQPSNQTFNGTKDWTAGNELLYQAYMPPGTQHTVTVRFLSDTTYQRNSWGVGNVVYVQIPIQVSEGHSLSKGAIAVISVCCALIVAAIAFFVFTKAGRRIRAKVIPLRQRSNSIKLDILHEPNNNVTPFPSGAMATRHDSDISLKASTPQPLPLLNTTSALGTTSQGSPITPTTESHTPSGQTTSQPVTSAREKQESLAFLLPHLTSGAGPSGALPISQASSPIRETDSGRTFDLSSPTLPPEYDPKWAPRR